MTRVLMLTMALIVTQAAPSRAAERATMAGQGLRDCPGGGVILPGSDACLRLSGGVTAAAAVRTAPRALEVRRALTRSDAAAHIELDLRAPTSLGPVRVYTSVRLRDGLGGSRADP